MVVSFIADLGRLATTCSVFPEQVKTRVLA